MLRITISASDVPPPLRGLDDSPWEGLVGMDSESA
jgi:hypothetical protein